MNKDFSLSLIENYLHQLSKIAHGGTAKHITRPYLLNFDVSLPSLPEQEKIAGFLGALDERIENLTLKLEALKQEKKAYSQQMFG